MASSTSGKLHYTPRTTLIKRSERKEIKKSIKIPEEYSSKELPSEQKTILSKPEEEILLPIVFPKMNTKFKRETRPIITKVVSPRKIQEKKIPKIDLERLSETKSGKTSNMYKSEEVKIFARALGLSPVGTKAELVRRVREAYIKLTGNI